MAIDTAGLMGLIVMTSVCLFLLMRQSSGRVSFNPSPKTANEAIDSLVMANRILAVEGIFDYAGHVSVRNPENPKTFFIARSAAPETVTKADIVEVDLEGNVVTKTTMKPYAERIIHARILNARPDMNAVVHAHPIPLVAFSVSDVPLKPVAHSSARFIDSTGVPIYDEYDFKSPGSTGMLVTTKEEGDRLARKLGESTAVLMRGHGFTAVGTDIPDLIMAAIGLRNNALVQLAAVQLGKVKCMSSEEARTRMKSAGGTLGMERAWNAYVGRVKKAMPDLR